jgi:hypothetical protein
MSAGPFRPLVHTGTLPVTAISLGRQAEMMHEPRIYNFTIGRSWHVMILWANSASRSQAVRQGFLIAHQFGRAALRRVFHPQSRGSLTVLARATSKQGNHSRLQ